MVQDGPSELGIVLVGRTGAGKSAAGNTILGEKVFKSEFSGRSVTKACEKKEGNVSGRPVAVIDTPGLFDTKLSADAVEQEIMKCLALSASGPRVFLLVIQLGRMTEEVKETVERLQEMFGEEAVKHTILLFTYGDKLKNTTIEDFIKNTDEDFQQLVEKFGNRYHVFNNENMSDRTQVTELLEKIDRMVTANKNIQVKDAPTGLLSNRSQSNTLRMVLVGRTGNGKSASGNTILGREAFISTADADSVTKQCEQREGMVAGRHVELVDMPGLYDTKRPLEEIREEIARSIILSAPGPQAFLLVIQVGRFTEEERRAVEIIQGIFGKDAAKYVVVLFTHADKLNNQKIETFVGKNKELRELVEKCEGRYHAFNNNKKNKRDHTQVTELLEKVESMVAENGGSCYTNEMYQKAEEAIRREQERILRETEEEERKKKEEEKLKREEEMKQRKKELEEKMKRELEEERIKMEEELKREREAMKKREQEEQQKREEERKKREKELEEKMKSVKEEERKRMEEELKRELEAKEKKQQEEQQKIEEEVKKREKELEEKMKRELEEKRKRMEEEFKREREAMKKKWEEDELKREEERKKDARNQAIKRVLIGVGIGLVVGLVVVGGLLAVGAIGATGVTAGAVGAEAATAAGAAAAAVGAEAATAAGAVGAGAVGAATGAVGAAAGAGAATAVGAGAVGAGAGAVGAATAAGAGVGAATAAGAGAVGAATAAAVGTGAATGAAAAGAGTVIIGSGAVIVGSGAVVGAAGAGAIGAAGAGSAGVLIPAAAAAAAAVAVAGVHVLQRKTNAQEKKRKDE